MKVKDGARAILLSASVVVLIAGVRFASPFLVPFLLATFLAIATSPLVARLRRAGAPRLVAVSLGLLADVAILGGLVALVARALRNLSRSLPIYEQRTRYALGLLSDWLNEQGFAFTLEALQQLDPGAVVSVLSSVLQGTVATLFRGLLVLILVGFMLLEAPGIKAKLVRGGAVVASLETTTARVRTYVLVKTVTSLITGVLAGTLCYLLDVDLPVLWGLLAYLLNYIPTFGSIIAAVPPTLVAFMSLGAGPASLVAAGYIVINILIGTITEPRWMGRALGISPLAVLLSMLCWGLLLGPAGALLSAPLTMLTRDWLLATRDLRWAGELLGDDT